MLSNETAAGSLSHRSGGNDRRIAERIEREQINSAARSNNKQSIPNAISSAVSQIAEQLGHRQLLP
jgi:pyruvate kinase